MTMTFFECKRPTQENRHNLHQFTVLGGTDRNEWSWPAETNDVDIISGCFHFPQISHFLGIKLEKRKDLQDLQPMKGALNLYILFAKLKSFFGHCGKDSCTTS